MSTLVVERRARAQRVSVTDEELIVELDDGRTISVPLVWFPRLLHGMPEEWANWRLIGDGEGIHWPDLDEDIEVCQPDVQVFRLWSSKLAWGPQKATEYPL